MLTSVLRIHMRSIVSVAVATIALFAGPASAEDMSAEQRATAHWIVEQARAWADQACGGKWVISDLLADDFRGTAPKGVRYEKPTGPPPPRTDSSNSLPPPNRQEEEK